MALTETDIKTFKPLPGRHRWVSDGGGLYLRIMPTDRRSWIWRTKKAGKTSYFTIGDWPDMTAKAARIALAKRTGKATPPNALTVADALEEWYGDQIGPRYRVVKNIRTYVDRASAEFGKRRLQELTRAEVARFVRGYAKETPVAANRCLSVLKLALSWCVEMGYLDHSPGDGLTRRIAGGDEQTRSRVMSDEEIREIWRLDSPNANLLRGLLLTGCRIAELQKASPEHRYAGADKIEQFHRDPAGDWLMIPTQNSKNGRAHHVYLVPEACIQLNGIHSVSPTAIQAWVRRMQTGDDDTPREPWAGIRPIDKDTGKPFGPWTPHDARRTFASRLGDLGIAPHVIEKLLNHTAQGVAAIYNRAELLPERIAATKKWAEEIERLVNHERGAK